MKQYEYHTLIKEVYLDSFGHMNNAAYLILFEEARWDVIANNGYGVDKIMETGLGPTILELQLKFHKELRVRDRITIQTEFRIPESKVSKCIQRMILNGEVCSTLELLFGLFSLSERRLVTPTKEWLQAIGGE